MSASPSVSTSVASLSKQTSAKTFRRTSIARASNTRRRYFDTKVQCAYNSKNTESFAPHMAFIAHGPTVSSVRETLPSLQVRTTSRWCAAPTDALLRRRVPLSAVNWNTSCRGAAVLSSSCRRGTPAEDVRNAIMSRQRTGGHNSGSTALHAVWRRTPIGSARSTFSGRDTPVAPVK